MSTPRALADAWRQARHVVVLTGAGLSTASGIPDFRSPGGRWERYQPVPLPEFLASERAREAYWRYKGETWQLIRAAEPNAAHAALADLARAGRIDLLVTQNVDGLHERSGFPPERLVNIHGTDSAVECMACHRRAPRAVAQAAWEAGTAVPRCDCGGGCAPRRARPGHDPHRYGRDVRLRPGRVAGRRGDRGAARAGLPRLQGAAAERLARGGAARVRGEPPPPAHGSPRLLPPPLAGPPPAGGHHRRLRAAPARGEGPRLGRQQLRRRGDGARGRDRGRRAYRVRPGALPPRGAHDRARGDPVVRHARHRRGGLQPVRLGPLPGPAQPGRTGAGRDRGRARRDGARGGARLPRARAGALHDSQGRARGARGRERRGGRPRALRGGRTADRRRVPTRALAGAPDALGLTCEWNVLEM